MISIMILIGFTGFCLIMSIVLLVLSQLMDKQFSCLIVGLGFLFCFIILFIDLGLS